ncbi:MAG: type III-B CRISPR module RAMP protein Cmr6 [Planctomycetota bacterium]|jgi:CRISPR-associated protein Cmr6|nr:type III-B CRISPR module RAMP protein Cmr6 [Planctomycetota bacterium]
MLESCRKEIKDTADGDNAGLLLARYLVAQETSDKVKRGKLFDRACGATAKAKSVYEKAFDRWRETLEKSAVANRNNLMREFTVDGRLIIGLGGENILETGLTLHHTYGVPYIPGAALKGLCAHYAHSLGGDFAKESAFHRAVFGDPTSAGRVQFHDAWIDPESAPNCLVDDVMTPHHSKYYSGEAAPTDFDSPVPVTFLAVTGKFLVVLTCDDTDTKRRENWIKAVWELLGAALKETGIGGKTNSGYGYGQLRGLSKDKKAKTETPALPAAPTNWLAAKLAESKKK